MHYFNLPKGQYKIRHAPLLQTLQQRGGGGVAQSKQSVLKFLQNIIRTCLHPKINIEQMMYTFYRQRLESVSKSNRQL